MKLEIDFDNKTIEVKDDTTMGDLIAKLRELRLKDWKEFKIKRGDNSVSYIPWYPTTTPWPTDPIYGTGTKPCDPPYKVTCGDNIALYGNTVSN